MSLGVGLKRTAAVRSVQHCRRTGHRLLEAEFLVACGQPVERLAAAELGLAAPGENVFGTDAAVGADLAAGDPPRVEKLDQVRPRHLQKLGRLPRRVEDGMAQDAQSLREPLLSGAMRYVRSMSRTGTEGPPGIAADGNSW